MPVGYFPDLYQPPWMRQNPWTTGAALGNAIVQAKATEQQMQQQAQMFPLKMEALRQQNEVFREKMPLELEQIRLGNQLNLQAQALNTIAIQNQTEAHALKIKREQSLGELARTTATIADQGLFGTDTAATFISGLKTRAPWLIGTPELSGLEKMQENARAEKAKAAEQEQERELKREIWGVRTESAEKVAQIRADERTNRIAAGVQIDPEDRREADVVLARLKQELSQTTDPAEMDAYETRAKSELNAIRQRRLARIGSKPLTGSTNAPPTRKVYDPATGMLK